MIDAIDTIKRDTEEYGKDYMRRFKMNLTCLEDHTQHQYPQISRRARRIKAHVKELVSTDPDDVQKFVRLIPEFHQELEQIYDEIEEIALLERAPRDTRIYHTSKGQAHDE
jgi:hypothetical protein